jgi:hypothetical protein
MCRLGVLCFGFVPILRAKKPPRLDRGQRVQVQASPWNARPLGEGGSKFMHIPPQTRPQRSSTGLLGLKILVLDFAAHSA